MEFVYPCVSEREDIAKTKHLAWQILKSISARQMFIKFPEIRKQLWGGEFWSDGGYIGTLGDGVNSEIVKRYIQEQGSEAEKARA